MRYMYAREKKIVHITKSDKVTLHSCFAFSVKTKISLVNLPTKVTYDEASI